MRNIRMKYWKKLFRFFLNFLSTWSQKPILLCVKTWNEYSRVSRTYNLKMRKVSNFIQNFVLDQRKVLFFWLSSLYPRRKLYVKSLHPLMECPELVKNFLSNFKQRYLSNLFVHTALNLQKKCNSNNGDTDLTKTGG